MNEILQKLSEPFAPEYVSWKPGQAKGDKCMVMAFADLRAYQRRLDEVCGLDWSIQYEPWGNDRIIAKLTIAGSTRCSTGEHNAQDEKNNMAGTVAEAQAMKRAAAMFGLGRYLYELPSAWVDFDATAKRISKAGQADLDRRYRDWYNRTMAAQRKPPTTPQTPATPVEQPGNVDGALKHVSTPHQRLFGQLSSGFGADAEAVRPWLISKWTEKATSSNTRSSATELSDDEKDVLADYINEHLTTLQRVWSSHKAQATVERQPQAV